MHYLLDNERKKKSDQEKKLLLWVVTRKGPLQDNTNAILNLPSDDTAAMLSKSYKPETKGPTCNQ